VSAKELEDKDTCIVCTAVGEKTHFRMKDTFQDEAALNSAKIKSIALSIVEFYEGIG